MNNERPEMETKWAVDDALADTMSGKKAIIEELMPFAMQLANEGFSRAFGLLETLPKGETAYDFIRGEIRSDEGNQVFLGCLVEAKRGASMPSRICLSVGEYSFVERLRENFKRDWEAENGDVDFGVMREMNL